MQSCPNDVTVSCRSCLPSPSRRLSSKVLERDDVWLQIANWFSSQDGCQLFRELGDEVNAYMRSLGLDPCGAVAPDPCNITKAFGLYDTSGPANPPGSAVNMSLLGFFVMVSVGGFAVLARNIYKRKARSTHQLMGHSMQDGSAAFSDEEVGEVLE